MRTRHLLSILAAALPLLGLLFFVGAADGADGPRPGLPPAEGGRPGSTVQGGTSEARRAKQWARVPMQVVALYVRVRAATWPGPGPAPDNYNISRNDIFFMAENGARHAYGLSAPFEVRTVAFGSIPVKATLRLEQSRTEEGLPVPFVVEALDEYWSIDNPNRPAEWPALSTRRTYDTHVEEEVHVEIETVQVDGVNLRLRAGCRTARPAHLSLLGRGQYSGLGIEDDPWATGHFTPSVGGVLTGSVDIPAFANCRTAAGEDVSPLLSTAISADDNEVTLNVGNPWGCEGRELTGVGEWDPYRYCSDNIPPLVDLPTEGE